jgi:hypothetical protein
VKPLLALALGAAVVAAPRLAAGNGGNSHTWITFHAIDHLPDGHLKELLSRPEMRTMLVNGAVFPDGGYVVDDDYGEMSHWEPFVEAYIRWIRDTQDHPFNQGEAGEHVAFLMGLASHGMADQVFDSTFMDAARIHDAAGWSEELLDSFDTATDVILVAETGVNYLDTLPWVPADDLSALYADAFGYEVSPGVLDSTQELLHRFVLNYAVSSAADPADVMRYTEQYPWAAANLMEPSVVGSPPCEGEVVADYLLAIWDRLHEVSGTQNHVIATYPRDGAAGHPTDYSLVESQVVIVFGSGIYEDQLAGHFTITDSTGKSYELSIGTQWGADEANLVKLRPLEDWAEDETFTVTMLPGLTTNDGFTLEAWSFTFSTGGAAGDDPTSDPTPHEGEPDLGEAPGGCCSTGGGGGGSIVLALLVLVTFPIPRRGHDDCTS